MPALYNPDVFRNTLKQQLIMCYGANNHEHYFGILMTLVRLIQSKHYDRTRVVITEYQAFQKLCDDPNVFRIFEGHR